MDEYEGEDEVIEQRGPLPGDRLRIAREARGMSLAQVAAETRINERHLDLIESNRFSDLPGRTYAIGFTRTYARALGERDDELVEGVKQVLDEQGEERPVRHAAFEPGDPARTPSSKLGWLMALALVLLLVGGFAFYSTYLSPEAELGSIVEEEAVEAPTAVASATPAAPPSEGPVVFTATADEVWVRFYDGDESNVLSEQILARGDSYTIPAGATDPRIRTGRPDAFAITVGGQRVEPLATEQFVMSDVSVSAQGLAGRGTEPAATPSAAASPAAGATTATPQPTPPPTTRPTGLPAPVTE